MEGEAAVQRAVSDLEASPVQQERDLLWAAQLSVECAV